MRMTHTPVISDYAFEVRSKNAGPFWTTLELFMLDEIGYEIVADEEFINEAMIADLYRISPDAVQIYRIPSLKVVKVSFPRRVPHGSLLDRDLHSGQQHVPLANLAVPERLLPPLPDPSNESAHRAVA